MKTQHPGSTKYYERKKKMKKDFMESRLEVILLDGANIICTSGCKNPPPVPVEDETGEMGG